MWQELEEELLLHYVGMATPEHFVVMGPEEIDDAFAHAFVPLSFVVSDAPEWEVYAQRLRSRAPGVPIFVADEQEVLGYIARALAERCEREGRMASATMPKPAGVRGSFLAPAPPALSEVLFLAMRLVVCEGVTLKRNVGAILRLARELRYDAVLFALTEPYPYARIYHLHSAGASYEIPVVSLANWPDDLDLLKAQGFTVVGTALRKDALRIDDVRFKEVNKIALLLGSEHDGLTQEALERCDYTAIIPMREGVDSLNVASAAAIALYELGDAHGTDA